MSQRFWVGVNYLPRRAGLDMWRRFDHSAIAQDFAQMASLRIVYARIFLPWDDFQPEPDRIDATVLAHLERVVQLARDAGIGLMPTFAGVCADTPLVPAWASDAAGRANDIYRGDLLAAQLRWIETVARTIGNHDAIVAWDIAHKFSAVRQPSRGKLRTGGHETAPASEADVAAWARWLYGAIGSYCAAPVTVGTWSADLLEDRNVRLTSLTMPLDFASMQASSIRAPFARNRLDAQAVPFLASLTQTFAHKPVMVTAFGAPICPPNKLSMFEQLLTVGEPGWDSGDPADPLFAPFACLTDDEAAAYARDTLDLLHRHGALGAFWWCWSDYDADVARPHAPYQRACGLVRADGTEKPVAAAVSAFAREERQVVAAGDALAVGAEYFYRTLPTSARTLYAAWLARHEA